MNILIISQVFWPENFKINDLSLELIKRGHHVTVITGKPNYPKGRFLKGYGFFSRVKSSFKDVIVYRLPIIPRLNGSPIMMTLNYLSFAFIGSVFSLFHKKKYDFTLVFAVSPITSAIPAIVHKKMFGTPMFLWILDLWPESLIVTKGIRNKIFIRALDKIVSFIYNSSDRILISSKFMAKSVSKRINKKKIEIEYLPNWAEDLFNKKEDVDCNRYKNVLPVGFIIMFAGNIGYAQDVESIVKLGELLKDNKKIKFVIIGAGSKKNKLVELINNKGLNNFTLLGSYPLHEMPYFFCHANVFLITLRNKPLYSFTVPGKLQTYMMSKKPIIGMINGETAEIINKAKCGMAFPAGDYLSLSVYIKKLLVLKEEDLIQTGLNGYNYCLVNFNKDKLIDSLLRVDNI